MYAAGKIPGSFFRREGKASDQAILTCRLIDRPLRPSLPRRLPQRGPRRRHHPRRRPGQPPRRARHQRRLGGADALGHPLRGPDRRRAGRLQRPTASGSRTPPTRRATTSTFELVVAGRALLDERRRVAIMMVEAGGTEKAWQYYEAGAPKVTEEVIADGPRGGQDLDPRVDRAPARAGRAGRRPQARAIAFAHLRSTTPTRSSRPGRGGRRRPGRQGRTPITDKAERNAATDEAGRARSSPSWPTEFAERRAESRSRPPSGR